MAKLFVMILVVLLVAQQEFRPYQWAATAQAYFPGSEYGGDCITSSEIQPVCGSDGLTYNSPSALICARRRNIGLVMSHEGPCNQY